MEAREVLRSCQKDITGDMDCRTPTPVRVTLGRGFCFLSVFSHHVDLGPVGSEGSAGESLLSLLEFFCWLMVPVSSLARWLYGFSALHKKPELSLQ